MSCKVIITHKFVISQLAGIAECVLGLFGALQNKLGDVP